MKKPNLRRIQKEIAKNIEAVRTYEVTYRDIAEKISVVADPTMDFSGRDMKADMDAIRDNKNLGRKERLEVLSEVLDKSIQVRDMMRTHTGKQVRLAITVDILMQARESARYAGMAGSAETQGQVVNEEDFFIRTARKAFQREGKWNRETFASALNAALTKAGYNKIPPYLL